ncbi:MAG: TetR/AcrR family transcriptional regulator [Rhizobiales bacterium]|uniref:HTH tetR-type domain-containing protein n=2 Tax=Xanthobacter flavus TaxID=281 RepID=A0A9W6FKY0_XANFL|nr:TetR/AcrR family transcriptional regulator [Hyphomicrobiales bacterium]GLI23806.1 hypothetical protein XFLAVUS301_34800 [Xanthobacter flavus]
MAARPYRQVARESAVRSTEQQIVEAFATLMQTRWFDEVTLDEIAAAAGTTRQTVIRRFGSKAGLLSALAAQEDTTIRTHRWQDTPADIPGIIGVLIADYERSGDLVVRTLNQEDRIPEFRPVLDQGRRGHREWITDMFRPWLDRREGTRREDLLAELLAVTDVWIWHLMRRRQGHSPERTQRLMTDIVERLLREV